MRWSQISKTWVTTGLEGLFMQLFDGRLKIQIFPLIEVPSFRDTLLSVSHWWWLPWTEPQPFCWKEQSGDVRTSLSLNTRMCLDLQFSVFFALLLTVSTIHSSCMADWLDTTSAKASLAVNSHILLNLRHFTFLKIIIYELFSVFEISSSSCASNCL